MTGVILAGGQGTRLRPMTEITNKHLLPVYDRPMIDYPIQTLRDMGCTSVVLVSGGNHIGDFAEYLGDGSRHGIDITYKVQKEAGGIAQALGCVAGLEGLFPVILGDNYFETAPAMPKKPSVFIKSVDDPQRFGVYYDGDIQEKPVKPLSDKAVVGLYVYDERVFDMITDLEPSDRGEFEITDINNRYLSLGAQAIELTGYWHDMGTVESLNEVSNYVRAL